VLRFTPARTADTSTASAVRWISFPHIRFGISRRRRKKEKSGWKILYEGKGFKKMAAFEIGRGSGTLYFPKTRGI
jgi:hypothetical protein